MKTLESALELQLLVQQMSQQVRRGDGGALAVQLIIIIIMILSKCAINQNSTKILSKSCSPYSQLLSATVIQYFRRDQTGSTLAPLATEVIRDDTVCAYQSQCLVHDCVFHPRKLSAKDCSSISGKCVSSVPVRVRGESDSARQADFLIGQWVRGERVRRCKGGQD